MYVASVAVLVFGLFVFCIAASFGMLVMAFDSCDEKTKELLKRVLRRKKGGDGK